MPGRVLALAVLVLVASCSLSRPGVELTIAGIRVVPSAESSYCQSGACSSICADGPTPVAPVTSVRAPIPVRLDFTASPEVNQLRGDIWLGETIAGAPIESFTLTGSARSHTSTQMRDGRYYIHVAIGWSRIADSGNSGRAFLVELMRQ